MSNIFSGLINQEFKNIFNQAIDSLLETGALSVRCRLEYNNEYPDNITYCDNCIFDPISQKSSSLFDSANGYAFFADGSVCPVCNGIGKIIFDASEIINLAVILDSKYWLNYGPKNIQIPDLAAQTLCSIELSPKIAKCTSMSIVNTYDYSPIHYSKTGVSVPMGLGDHKYILTNWTK